MDSSLDFQTHNRISPPTSIDKPIRPPRSTDSSAVTTNQFLFQHRQRNSNGSIDDSTEIYNPSDQFLTTGNYSINGYYGNKPTVQVHPMPGRYTTSLGRGASSLSSSTSSISPPETLKKSPLIPPPVPKKPLQLSKRLEQLQQQKQDMFQEEQERDENILNQSNSFEVFIKFKNNYLVDKYGSTKNLMNYNKNFLRPIFN